MKLSEIIRYLEESHANPVFKWNAENAPDINVSEVFCDSRKVAPGSIFCCVSGEKSDGHNYISSAESAGAVAVLAEKHIPECSIPQIIVDSTRKWMGKVAAKVYGEPAKKLKMYAVTGTNGKTTTTWVIRSLLESAGEKCGLIGTIIQNDGLNDYASERTTPESCDIQRLLSHMVRNGCKACVMETSSHGLDIGRLDGCEYDVMVFNNLNPEHLDYHKTMENYFDAKCILFDKYSKKDGKIVVNAEDAYGKRIIEKYGRLFKVVSFAIDSQDADLSARMLNLGIDGSKFEMYVSGNYIEDFYTPLVAAFNVKNTLAAISAVYEKDIDVKLLVDGVARAPQIPGRVEKHFIPIGDDKLASCCIIDFAHTPEALKNVLSALKEFCTGRVISVFGHGGGRYQANRPALGSIAAALADKIIITMDNPRQESPEDIAEQIAAGVKSSRPDMDMKIIVDRKKAIKAALDEVQAGDVVVLSGKGPENYLIIGDEYLPYSDAGEVQSWLDNKREEEKLPLPCRLVLDSREIKTAAAKGTCGFVALTGKNTDGHLYIEQALSDGAKFIVGKSSGKSGNFPKDVPYIALKDTERDLAHIAKKYIDVLALKEVIAITGSVGKTTTREAVKRALKRKYRVHAAERSYNTLIGCAVSILSMPADTEILILEFGANKPGEIRELTEIFAPSIAVITEVAPVHLEGFVTIDGVLGGKMEIAGSRNLKTFVYNADNLLLSSSAEGIREKCRVLSIGRSNSADYRISDISKKCCLPMEWELIHSGRSQVMRAEFWGKHPMYALSIAAAIGNELGVEEGEICEAASEYKPLYGRGRIIYTLGRRMLIDDAYNANPASMTASLSSFLELDIEGNKWAVLGDMRELGEEELKYHKDVSRLFAGIDKVLLIGGIWKNAASELQLPNCVYFDSWQDTFKYVSENNDWKAMLVKGSNSHKLEEFVAEVEKRI
ncbi:MAG: UDP-N-acetylmuramoyl-L-alanyl-D-glutamate--2,6-diaminopimelate ligase [Synergistaceae bacterium]|nr:UDP-N-acetylmuramoyl-L-alanyl-D-glutamate--2,6-diaminopimelate ligase [Synergistaceae bacterium]